MPTAIIDLYLFDTQFIEENSAAIEAFVRGVFQGLEFLETNRDEGLAIAAKKLGTTPEALAADLEGITFPDIQTNLEMLGDPNSDLYLLNPLNAMGEFMVSQKKISKVPDFSKVLEPRFVKALSTD